MLKIENLYSKAGNFRLQDISLSVKQGEYIVLAGPSGAGKTVLLETIAGLRKAEKGKIWYNGNDITKAGAGKRPFTLLFQDLALFPHLKVSENISYAVHDRKTASKTLKELAAHFSVTPHLDKRPHELSGGERQRIALARAMACAPEILLLDEPLSSLDNYLKKEIMQLLFRVNQDGQTIIHVTHDVKEAINLADRTGIVQNGMLRQFGTTTDILNKPGDRFTAAFAGVENIIDISRLTVPENEFPAGISWIGFNSSNIIFENPGSDCIRFSGKLLKRPSGKSWLQTPAGFISIKENITRYKSKEMTVFVRKEDILFLK